MAHVASNVPTAASSNPLMDRLTHAVIKETSKNLRYYIDVKHRENAFILNPNSTANVDAPVPLRARFLNGRPKNYSTLYNSTLRNNNFRQILPNYQQQKQAILISPEKQMCREELNFHMRSYRFFPTEHPKTPDPRLRAIHRSHSACSSMREGRPKSALKLTRHEKDQLIDDAANLLANMVKTRQSIHETPSSIRQSPLMYITRSLDPSPRQSSDHQYRLRSAHHSISNPTTDSRTFSMSQMSTESRRSKETSILSAISKMSMAKPIIKGFLCQYKVSIMTGNCNGASTTAPIRIKFYGSKGCTDFHELMESETHRVPFVKAQTDIFTIQTYHVGKLIGITIGHNRLDMRSSWYLKNVTIEDSVTDTTYDIACNAWLSIKSFDQKTIRDFPVTSTLLKKEKNDGDDHADDNRSQSDYSTTVTEGTVTLNKSQDDENDSISDLPAKNATRKKQHVSIGPTFIAKKPSMITANTSHLSRASPPATITIEQRFNREEHAPVTIPVRRFNSPALSTTSSDTELKGTMANGTGSTTTPTPTLNPIGLQSISEDENVRKPSKISVTRRPTLELERPPARLDQRSSSVSILSERSAQNKNKKKN